MRVWVHEMRDDFVIGVYASLDAAVRELKLGAVEPLLDEETGLRYVESDRLGDAVLGEMEVVG